VVEKISSQRRNPSKVENKNFVRAGKGINLETETCRALLITGMAGGLDVTPIGPE